MDEKKGLRTLKKIMWLYILIGSILTFLVPMSLPYIFAYFVPEARLDIFIFICVALAILFAIIGFIFLKHAKILADMLRLLKDKQAGLLPYRMLLILGLGLIFLGAFLPIQPTQKAALVIIGVLCIIADLFVSEMPQRETEVAETDL